MMGTGAALPVAAVERGESDGYRTAHIRVVRSVAAALPNAPRFIAFCKKVGLPPPSESEALSSGQVRAANAAHRVGVRQHEVREPHGVRGASRVP